MCPNCFKQIAKRREHGAESRKHGAEQEAMDRGQAKVRG